MADTNKILSVIATTGSKIQDLTIKNGQLIFIQDKQRIALDFNDKRVFYNQINILNTDNDRQSLLAPIDGLFYFVIETAILWTYNNSEWIKITINSEDVVFIGDIFPQSGNEKTLYVDKVNKNISIWNKESESYDIIANKTDSITELDINNLFI